MHIYRRDDLYNKHIQQQASEAFLNESIGEETFRRILLSFPTNLFTPNFFIRLALGLLTLVAITFSGLLVGLVFNGSVTAILLFLAIFNYAALEIFVKSKWYYNAGIDNLLMLFSTVFLVGVFMVQDYPGQYIVVSGVAIVVCLFQSIRFTDAFMGSLAYLAMLVFVFLLYIKLGNIARSTASFLIMLVSACAYYCSRKLAANEKYKLYRFCCQCILYLALCTFYAAGNYFVVRELSNELFDLHLTSADYIPFGWLFWLLTFIIPIAYVAFGIRKNELEFIRIGLLLIPASVFTFRFYYHIIAIEVALVAAGLVLILIAYSLIKYLKLPRHGFFFEKEPATDKERIDLKSLVITQLAGKNRKGDNGVEFGGGSFGSGGAGGGF